MWVQVPRCGMGFFSLSQLPVQTLLQCPFSSRVQSHASISVHMLKIPNTGSHTVVWTPKILHTLICSSSCCALSGMVAWIFPGTWTMKNFFFIFFDFYNVTWLDSTGWFGFYLFALSVSNYSTRECPKSVKKQQQNKMLVSVKHRKSVNYLPWNSKSQ